MSDPLITVIVPVYKVEKYLKRCVDSICMQTYRNLEIILVDDGSPDRCGELCDEFAEKDNRIRVIHKENGGLSDARNAGLDVMTGEYVGFVDSDDWICPQMYETLYRRLIEKQAQISCCGIDRCTDDGHQSYFNPNVAEAFTLNRVDALKELTRNQRITNSVCDKLYRSDLFDKLRMTTGILFEDFQVQPHCIAQAERVTYTAEPLYCYYLSPQSILRGNYSIRQYDSIRISRECIGFYQKNFAECVPYAQAEHISLVLDMIYRSTGKPEWKELRKELIREMRRPLLRAAVQKLEKKNKMKLWVLRLNTFLYTKVMTMYYMHSA
jgi:Glycosyltransferases involved in cell wall biogenesis